MYMLIQTFRNTTSNYRKILLLIRARSVGIDKSSFTRYQVAITNEAPSLVFQSANVIAKDAAMAATKSQPDALLN